MQHPVFYPIFSSPNPSKTFPQNKFLNFAKFAWGYGPIFHVATPLLSPNRDPDRCDTVLSFFLMSVLTAVGY